MATNTKLAPWRQYDEADVLNLFAYSGAIPVTAGTVVKPVASGWRSDEAFTQLLGDVGAHYNNTVSQRFGTLPCVTDAGSGDNVLGILLYDVREQDENGLLYKFNPRKAIENSHTLSGQTSPILTRGFILISGTINGGATAGAQAYASGAGALTTTSTNQTNASTVGKFFGGTDSNGFALLYVNIQ